MYEIRKSGALLCLTDAPNYIRRHPEGFYLLCAEEEAEGVAVNGAVYALSEGSLGEAEAVVVAKCDGGTLFLELQARSAENASLCGQSALAARRSVQDLTDLTDEEALQMPDLMRSWDDALGEGRPLAAQSVLRKDGVLYRVQQAVTPLAHQPPDGEGMLALYRPIEDRHAGTREDPIVWRYGMDCLSGLYYRHAGALWRCAGEMKPCVWPPERGVWQWESAEV